MRKKIHNKSRQKLAHFRSGNSVYYIDMSFIRNADTIVKHLVCGCCKSSLKETWGVVLHQKDFGCIRFADYEIRAEENNSDWYAIGGMTANDLESFVYGWRFVKS